MVVVVPPPQGFIFECSVILSDGTWGLAGGRIVLVSFVGTRALGDVAKPRTERKGLSFCQRICGTVGF